MERNPDYSVPFDMLLRYCQEAFASPELIYKYLEIIPDPKYMNRYGCNALSYYCECNADPNIDVIIKFLQYGVEPKGSHHHYIQFEYVGKFEGFGGVRGDYIEFPRTIGSEMWFSLRQKYSKDKFEQLIRRVREIHSV